MKKFIRVTRFAIYTFLFTLINASAFGQLDTIDVVLMVSDTSEQYYIDTKFTHGEIIDGKHVDYFEKDTVWTGNRSHEMRWIFGKEVRELHNTSEGHIDPGFSPDLWRDYWLHKEYLDEMGNKLPKGFIVWQSVHRKDN